MDWLAIAAAADGDAPALITPGRVVTYRELDLAASGVASIIAGSGSYGSGPVAFWGERTIEAVAAVWGIPRAGVTAVAVDPRKPPSDSMAATRSAGVRGLWITPDGGLERLVTRGVAAPTQNVRPDPSHVVFTSGTEGHPKGVMLTDDNLDAAITGSRGRLNNGPGDSWLCVLPLFHVGGLSILWRQAEAGAPVVLLDGFDPVVAAEALDGVSYASVVPVMLRRILETGREWSGLKAVLVGGAGADDRLLSEARSAGIPAIPTYGMTETCSQIATPSPGSPLDGSVGLPLPGAEIRVVQGAGAVVGIEGRIEVRGPMVSLGNVGEPARHPTSWLATGDIGMIDDAGRLHIVGRADRMIVTGGENVHPAAVERILGTNPEIRASHVFGLIDTEWGMRVVAEVETDAGVEALEEWARTRLAPSMRPREWRIVDRLGGKLDA